MQTPCTLLFYSEHPILALGLNSIVETENDFVLESIGSREEAVNRVREQSPDMLLLDLHSDFDLGFLQEIRKSGTSCKIVLWVDSISTETAYQAYSMGVRGIVQKVLCPETFLMHLRSIREGNVWIDKTLMNSIASAKTVNLTRREAQLVALLAQALKNKEIATALNVTENTVKAYLSRLFQKLGVKDRLELALYGLKNLSGAQNWSPSEPGKIRFKEQSSTEARPFQSILMQSQMRQEPYRSSQHLSQL